MTKINIKGDIVTDEWKWVYDYFGMPCTTPRTVENALDKARKTNETVNVYINSGGGDIFAGTEIHALLQAYPGELTIHVVGIAASAASVIACARTSDISPTSMVMIHNVSSEAHGDYRAMDKESEILKQANKAMAAAYTTKMGISEEEALELMNRESWITAKEAVEMGLIDTIAQPERIDRLVAADPKVLSLENLNKMKAVAQENKKLKAKIENYKIYIDLKETELHE